MGENKNISERAGFLSRLERRGFQPANSVKMKKRGNSFSLSDIHVKRLNELAEIFGISPSEVLRRAIDDYYLRTLERLSKLNRRVSYGREESWQKI